jgi:PAS domain S-box-containing protein
MIDLIHSTYFQDLLNGFSIGVIIFNSSGSIYAVNGSASKALGKNLTEYLGMPWKSLFLALDNLGGLDEMVSGILSDASVPPNTMNSRFIRDDGEVRQLALSASSLIYGSKLFGIVLEINDISDLFNLHENEKKILEEKALLQLERYEALHKLSMSVSHQIRNPIMAIGGMTKLLTKHVDPSSHEMDFARAMNDAAKRLEEIVTAVYEFSSFHLGDSGPADAGEIVRESVHLMESKFPDLYHRLNWRIDVEPCQLSLDHFSLSTAMMELFANAAESGNQSTVNVTVEGRAAESVYSFRISDDGKGIDEDDLKFVFDPFFTTKTLGVGMGLCKVERVVKELGGRVSIGSSATDGTTVSIVLPVPKVRTED